MILPNFPTDNLYKFSALVGTILLVGSLYIPYFLTTELEKQSSSINYKIHISKIETEYAHNKLQGILEILDNTKDKQKGLYIHDSNKVELYYSEKEVKELINESIEISKNVELGNAEIIYLDSEIDRLLTEVKLVIIISAITFLLGCFLAVYGYRQWYYKIQLYQDKMAKHAKLNKGNLIRYPKRLY